MTLSWREILSMLCVVLAVAFVPLILWVHPVAFDDGVGWDLHAYYKAAWLIVLGFLATTKMPPLCLTVPVILACAASKMQGYAWFGFPFQFMGGAEILALICLGYAAMDMPPRLLVNAVAVGSLGISAVAFAQKAGFEPGTLKFLAHGLPIEIKGLTPPMVSSTLYNSNYVGLYAAVVGPLLMSRWSWLTTTAFALLLPVVYFSHSRTGTFGMACGCAALVGLNRKYRSFALIAALLLVAAWLGYSSDHTLSFRTQIWAKTLTLITPWGSGPGVFPIEYDGFIRGLVVDLPHNLYLGIAHAFGWVGLIATLGALPIVGYRLGTRPDSAVANGLIASLVGLLVAGFANDMFIGVAPVAAVVIGMSARRTV